MGRSSQGKENSRAKALKLVLVACPQNTEKARRQEQARSERARDQLMLELVDHHENVRFSSE